MNGSKIFKELTDEEIQRIVKRHIQPYSGLQITMLKGGLFNTTYKLTLGSPSRELVLRIGPVNRQLLLPYEQDLMKAERYVYELLSSRQIPCPHIVACDTTKSFIDRDYTITEFIPSVPLTDLSAPEEDQVKLYEGIGSWTRRMHGVTGARFGRAADVEQGRGFERWGDFLTAQAAQIGEHCLQHHVHDEATVTRVVRLLEDQSRFFDQITTPHLVHTDLWAGNVLVGTDPANGRYEVAAIIDADRALFGDIDYEFASPWLINDAFLRGYGGYNLSGDESHLLKMDMYRLIYSYIDAYVWKVQYDNTAEYENNKKRLDELLQSIEARI